MEQMIKELKEPTGRFHFFLSHDYDFLKRWMAPFTAGPPPITVAKVIEQPLTVGFVVTGSLSLVKEFLDCLQREILDSTENEKVRESQIV